MNILSENDDIENTNTTTRKLSLKVSKKPSKKAMPITVIPGYKMWYPLGVQCEMNNCTQEAY